MKTRKNITCILLCLGMLLAMTACGNSGNAESTESVEIASAADAYLTMAQEFVAQENYDSAVEVLNKAKATLEDSRLDAMLAEIEAARQSVLTVEYQVNDSNLKTQGVEIHSVEAQILDPPSWFFLRLAPPTSSPLCQAPQEYRSQSLE